MDAFSYSEVWSILNQLEEKYTNKIPKNILELIDEKRIPNYDANIDLQIPLDTQLVGTYSTNLICYLNMEYFSTYEEKEILKKIYSNNEHISQNRQTSKSQNTNLLPMLIEKPKWYKQFLKKLKMLFFN